MLCCSDPLSLCKYAVLRARTVGYFERASYLAEQLLAAKCFSSTNEYEQLGEYYDSVQLPESRAHALI